MGQGPVFKLDANQLNAKLDRLESADRKPLLAAFGALMVRSIHQTIREEGSPSGSWRPLSALSLQARFQRRPPTPRLNRGAGTAAARKKGRATSTTGGNTRGFTRFVAGKTLLRDTGRLFGSISFAVDGDSAVRVGTNVVYAAALHFGFQYPPVTIIPRNARALRWFAADGAPIFARRSVVPARTLPARPFIVLRPEDPQTLARAAADYLQGIVGGRPAGAGEATG